MKNKILLISVAVTILMSGACTRYKDIVYLQEESQADSIASNFYPYSVPTYRIQQRDVLYINILSMNKEITDVINTSPGYSGNLYSNEAGFYIHGYNVNDSGYIEIPVIGKINVLGKTLEEAKTAIVKQTAKIIKGATVIVKLISFKYSVIGEVLKPGTYQNFNNQLTVLEAVSQAGDITTFGDRRKVMVIRSGVEGTKTFRLDLTSKSILTKEGFFLLPNDIVYVEPVRSRNFRNNTPTISLVFSAVTTFVLVLNYFR